MEIIVVALTGCPWTGVIAAPCGTRVREPGLSLSGAFADGVPPTTGLNLPIMSPGGCSPPLLVLKLLLDNLVNVLPFLSYAGPGLGSEAILIVCSLFKRPSCNAVQNEKLAKQREMKKKFIDFNVTENEL